MLHQITHPETSTFVFFSVSFLHLFLTKLPKIKLSFVKCQHHQLYCIAVIRHPCISSRKEMTAHWLLVILTTPVCHIQAS